MRWMLTLVFKFHRKIFVKSVVDLVINPHYDIFLISYNNLSQPQMCYVGGKIYKLFTNKKLCSLQENNLSLLILEGRKFFDNSASERINMENYVFIAIYVFGLIHSLVDFECWVVLIPLYNCAVRVHINHLLIQALFDFALTYVWFYEA